MQRDDLKPNAFGLTLEGKTRKDILDAALNAGKVGAHIAPSLSIVESALAILSCFDKSKDTFILSKGHGALGYYAAMHQMGFISDEQFSSFELDGGDFPGQPSRSKSNCIDYSSGSLGMGLSYGVGTAIAQPDGISYVIMGDGEANEGSIWEAASLAAQLSLGNLVVIVDNNGLQSDGTCNEILGQNLEEIWGAFGWFVCKCEGHSITDIVESIKNKKEKIPCVILAKTIKGKGVSFMENDNSWHHHELTLQDYQRSVEEIGVRYGLE